MSTSIYGTSSFHWLIAVLLLGACGGGGGSRVNEVGPDSGIVVDTPPQTSISVAPALITKDTTASIGFRSNQENSTFECRIDNGNIYSCNSPQEFDYLDDGLHRFEVRATNVNGTIDATWASPR